MVLDLPSTEWRKAEFTYQWTVLYYMTMPMTEKLLYKPVGDWFARC